MHQYVSPLLSLLDPSVLLHRVVLPDLLLFLLLLLLLFLLLLLLWSGQAKGGGRYLRYVEKSEMYYIANKQTTTVITRIL